MTLLKWEVENRCEHLGRQLHRNFFNPVKGFAYWQPVKDRGRTSANDWF